MIPSKFELVLTADQSPSFQLKDHPNQETMHHRGGAYSETQYIYGEAIRLAFHNKLTRFVSVGLGLGYNELLVACEAIRNGYQPTEVSLTSYELVDHLKTDFLAFVYQKETPDFYPLILSFFLKEYGLSSDQVQGWLKSAKEQNQWVLRGPLGDQDAEEVAAQCCLFDAFSSKTSPELWSPEFLDDYFQKRLAESCVFATYARTGNLKRALMKTGFILADKKGFAGRRESTLAWRGLNASAL